MVTQSKTFVKSHKIPPWTDSLFRAFSN